MITIFLSPRDKSTGSSQCSVPAYCPLTVTFLIPLSLDAKPLKITVVLDSSCLSSGSILISGEVSEDF